MILLALLKKPLPALPFSMLFGVYTLWARVNLFGPETQLTTRIPVFVAALMCRRHLLFLGTIHIRSAGSIHGSIWNLRVNKGREKPWVRSETPSM